MVEYMGFLYGLARDISAYLQWQEESKIVDREWLEKSGFKEVMEGQGFQLRWVRSDKVETRKLDEYELMYEVDQSQRIRRILERHGRDDKLVLMGKKST